MVKNNRYT